MTDRYIISVDQSTQGTKALLFDRQGSLISRTDLPHRQIVDHRGWISHDPEEIYRNTVQAVKNLMEENGITGEQVEALGISNQRETSVIWDRETGKPLAQAVVWQCARAEEICERREIREKADMIQERTGLKLSPYFPAAKIAWLLENVQGAAGKAAEHVIGHGTVDSWLIFCLTEGRSYRTDASNASRTQLFNIFERNWDEEICSLFGIDPENLPEVTDSDACFGETTLEGYFDRPVPVRAVMGDSHAALFGQGCLRPGMIKATYGTGSSIMMNIGEKPVLSSHGVVTSLAWSRGGRAEYVLEGNLNYTGAVITWLKNDLRLISSPEETQQLAEMAGKEDELYLVPAFSGLGAPYWDSRARAAVSGMDRTTGRAELVRAGLECIAYQIADVIEAMEKDAGIRVKELRVDGGPTRNGYLMQFQSDILDAEVQIPEAEELSGIGAAYMAGIASGFWDETVFSRMSRNRFLPDMEKDVRERKRAGWRKAVAGVLTV